MLLHGQERTSTASFAERPTTRFWVVKINKWGRKQERVLAIDSQRKELHGFDRSMNLKRVLPLTALVLEAVLVSVTTGAGIDAIR